MPQDVYVDLRYQGIELGSQLCMQEFTESAAYLQCPQPMPVGSALQVQVADDLEIELLVQRVHEQVSGSEKPAGMVVCATALEGPALQWWASHVGMPSAPAENPQASDDRAPDTEVMDVASPEDVAAAPEETSAPEEATAAEEATAPAVSSKESEDSKSAESNDAEAEPSGGKGKKRRRRKRR